MTSANYIPVLKCKSSDVKAISALYPSDINSIKPLFEIPVRPLGTTLESHIGSSISALSKNPIGMPFFFDPYGLLPEEKINEKSAELYALEMAVSLGATVCYAIEKAAPDWNGFKNLVATSKKGFAFRVPIEILEFSPEDLWEELILRAVDISVPFCEIDLLLDARSLAEANLDALREGIIDFMSYKPTSVSLRSVALLGSSTLDTVASVPKDGCSKVFRREYALWGELQFELSDSVKLGYGDYGIVHPNLLIAGPSKNANGKIRYTEGQYLHYFRGHALLDPSGLGYSQYHEIAQRVMDSGIYQSSGFSAGDKYISDCASNLAGPGNLGTWVTNDLNHHVSYVSRQIRLIRTRLQKAANANQVAEILAAS